MTLPFDDGKTILACRRVRDVPRLLILQSVDLRECYTRFQTSQGIDGQQIRGFCADRQLSVHSDGYQSMPQITVEFTRLGGVG